MNWRTLENEIIFIVRSNGLPVTHAPDGDTILDFQSLDFPIPLNLTTFAKELAKRMEQNE